MTPQPITSPDNPALAQVRRALRDPGAYRRGSGPLWLEGDHLLRACVGRGHALDTVLITPPAWADASLRELAQRGRRVLLLDAKLLAGISELASPAAIGALVARPASAPLHDGQPTLVLDRLQDAGNVGSILRSAAAFGFVQVAALKGTAALWSPKVLRAAMGAHFALQLHEALDLADLAPLGLPWLATSSHAPHALHEATLPQPCAWVLGHEGQGIAPELVARCAMTLRIVQPGGEESLNVAAAAAICLHESARRRAPAQ